MTLSLMTPTQFLSNMDDLPTTREFMDCMAAIENELMIERQVKQCK
jgi:hypothetical protein